VNQEIVFTSEAGDLLFVAGRSIMLFATENRSLASLVMTTF